MEKNIKLSDESLIKLIQLVKINPVLWETDDHKVKNSTDQFTIWNNIGHQVGLSGPEARDTFNELKVGLKNAKSRTKNSRQLKNESCWKFFSLLDFLDSGVITFSFSDNLYNVFFILSFSFVAEYLRIILRRLQATDEKVNSYFVNLYCVKSLGKKIRRRKSSHVKDDSNLFSPECSISSEESLCSTSKQSEKEKKL